MVSLYIGIFSFTVQVAVLHSLTRAVASAAFLIFFTIEMALKLIGMGPSRYWEDAWNKFDAIVVCSSWGGMVLNIQVQVVRAFRAFRIVLVLKNAAGLQALFKCLIWAILPSVNIGALLFLHFSLFAILGMQVFGDAGPHFDEVPRILPNSLANIGASRAYRLAEFTQTQQSVYTNFKTFFGTMKLLTECSSGKDWKIVMYEIYEVSRHNGLHSFFATRSAVLRSDQGDSLHCCCTALSWTGCLQLAGR